MKKFLLVVVLALVAGCSKWPEGIAIGSYVELNGSQAQRGVVKAKEGDWLVLNTAQGEVRIPREKITSVRVLR